MTDGSANPATLQAGDPVQIPVSAPSNYRAEANMSDARLFAEDARDLLRNRGWDGVSVAMAQAKALTAIALVMTFKEWTR